MTTMQSSPQSPTGSSEAKPPILVGSELATPSDASLSLNEAKPRLHAKTLLAVGAVCFIYFAQLVTLVGAGAVSIWVASCES